MHGQPPNGTVLTADLTKGIRAQDIGGLLWKGDFKSTAPPTPPSAPSNAIFGRGHSACFPHRVGSP